MAIVRALTAAFLSMVVATTTAPPATAHIFADDFPVPSDVRSIIDDSTAWHREVARVNEDDILGSRPPDCGSDQPFLAAEEFRTAYYRGKYRKGTKGPVYAAYVRLNRFPSKAAAKRAMTNTRAFVKRCPKSTEWVCTQCDGISTSWRHLAPIGRVGQRTVAWAGRRMGTVGTRFRRAVALDRAILVEVSVETVGDLDGPKFPQTRPSKRQMRELLHSAYLSAPVS